MAFEWIRKGGSAIGIAAIALIGSGCSQEEAPAPLVIVFPDSLNPIGDGYPAAGDRCRRLAASPSIARWLTRYSELVGCPENADADQIDGIKVGIVDDFVILAPTPPEAEAPNIAAEGGAAGDNEPVADTGE